MMSQPITVITIIFYILLLYIISPIPSPSLSSMCASQSDSNFLNVLQINVNGLFGSPRKQHKLNVLNTLITLYEIHVILIQEWTVSYRSYVTPENPYIVATNGKVHEVRFPVQAFPDFGVYYEDTNLCTLWRKSLNVTPTRRTTQAIRYNKKRLNHLNINIEINDRIYTITNI